MKKRRSWAASLFQASDLAVGKITAAMQAVHEGLWLGLLSRGSLQTVAELQYFTWDKYRTDDHNLQGLLSWEEAAVEHHFGNAETILVAATGGGREHLALAKKGFRCDSFDCTPVLVDSCREFLARHDVAGEVLLCEPDAVPEGQGTYAGAFVGWGGYMHIQGREHRVRFLRQLREHVEEGGPLMLSFLARKQVTRHMRWVYGIAKTLRTVTLRRDPIELGDTLSATFDHYFSRDEIEAELAAAGFKLVFYSDEPYGHAVGIATDS